jgi:glycosyltransferase involved in cell wall biosynthesis
MKSTEHPGDRIPVVVFMKHFAPGFKVGGPLQSVLGLLAFFSDTLAIRVITLNRDYTESQPYADVPTDAWTPFGPAQVMYRRGNWSAWRNLIAEFRADGEKTLYLQSFFNPGWSLLPLLLVRCGLIRPRRVVVAPRGELSDGALSIRPTKKRIFMKLARVTGLHNKVIFQATSGEEAGEIRARLGVSADRVVLLRNLPAQVPQAVAPLRPKAAGTLRMAFLSRISPKKNLHLILDQMADLPRDITLDIYGPVDDTEYLAQCKEIIERQRLAQRAVFHGAVPRDRIRETLQNIDVFVLPTKGENFGHAVYEALAHGVPVIVSDRTPWRSLWRDKAGCDVNLDEPGALRAAMTAFAGMDEDAMARFRTGAVDVAHRYIRSALDRHACDALFAGV